MPIVNACSPVPPAGEPSERTLRKYFCEAMWQSLAAEGERGISIFALLQVRKREIRRSIAGVRYKKSRADRGMIFNNCPFCSVSYRKWLEPHAKKEKRG